MPGIQVIRPGDRDANTVQTTGMVREAGVCETTTGATTIWSGYVKTPPGTVSGAHHHGDCETAIYVLSGRARFFFGETLEHVVEVAQGDFLYVPPNEVHVEQNLSETEPLEFIVSRGCSGIVVVNVPDPREGAHNH
ncbi:MAG: cupin domain-containing protein [Chloroflexi bacterium]|nr:cupin domain-containing protein [Chloroflexota bacterium]